MRDKLMPCGHCGGDFSHDSDCPVLEMIERLAALEEQTRVRRYPDEVPHVDQRCLVWIAPDWFASEFNENKFWHLDDGHVESALHRPLWLPVPPAPEMES